MDGILHHVYLLIGMLLQKGSTQSLLASEG
jgi:hypothetical protein